MKFLKKEDLYDIALGATFLGSGGGGDPEYDLLLAEQYFEEFGPAKIIEKDDLSDDDLVVPVSFMGAPLVSSEKLPSGKEFDPITEAIVKEYGKKPSCLVPAEIGGSNALVPLWIGARAGIPVLDADAIGRAFPKLEMCALNLQGIKSTPAFMACSQGRSVVVRADLASDTELLCRAICEKMGSNALAALYILSGKEAKEKLLHGSITAALALGRKLKDRSQELKIIGCGTICDIEQRIDGGFLSGKVKVKNREIEYEVLFQNEYYALFENGIPRVLTPDIIALLDKKSGLPLCVEALRFGLEVELLGYPVHPLWKTPQGMKLVGPEAFGMEVQDENRN
jgi:uncharacterized protein